MNNDRQWQIGEYVIRAGQLGRHGQIIELDPANRRARILWTDTQKQSWEKLSVLREVEGEDEDGL